MRRLLINELYPSPSAGETEWVEIYNAGQERENLQGWKLAKLSGGEVKSHEQIFGTEGEEGLDPGQFLVVEVQKLILNNTGATIYLFDPEEELADEVTYPSLIEKSWARKTDGGDEWQKMPPTKGISNAISETELENLVEFWGNEPIVTLAAQSSALTTGEIDRVGLALSEIMACPKTGEPEWIEVFNDSSIDWKMSNWKIKNKKGTSRLIKDQTIKAKSLNVIELSSGLLNNAGDEMNLETASGEVILAAEFGSCSEKGMSFVFDGSNWVETKKATKGGSNVFELGEGVVLAEGQTSFNGDNLVTSRNEKNGSGSGGDVGATGEKKTGEKEGGKEVGSENGKNQTNNISGKAGQQISGDWPADFTWPEVKLKVDEDLNRINSWDKMQLTTGGVSTNAETEIEGQEVFQFHEPRPSPWIVMPVIIMAVILVGIGTGGIAWQEWLKHKKERQNEKQQSDKEEKELADLF